jgi:hypothetical protein
MLRYRCGMSPVLLSELRARTEEVVQRWETLLRIEPISTPLANPDTLQYLIPEVWEQILCAARKTLRSPISLRSARAHLPACDCGNNPYRGFFRAAEQAVTETAVLIQSAQPGMGNRLNDLGELIYIIRKFARAEINAFCKACVFHGEAENCRFAELVERG